MSEADDLELAEAVARGVIPGERVAALADHPELRAHAKAGHALTEGSGVIDARVAVCLLPREQLAAMLPAGLQLAPQPLAPAGRHPLLVMFAHNDFTAWFGEMRYHEITLAVPWVEYAEERTVARGPFIYMPRLWLDASLPRVLGNRIYGYEKLPARVAADDGEWEIRDDDGDLLVRASFVSEGEPRAPAAWPSFEWMRRMLEQPTISQVRRVFHADARAHDDPRQSFYGSTVRYLLGADAPVAASIEPLRCELAFGGGLSVPGNLEQQPHVLPSLAADVVGGFRMRAAVRVSLPGSTEALRYPQQAGRKLRIAVLGGGPAACSAAYWLAQQHDRFEVDVYTMGWRLGGKCAASRNPDAHERIEEHGLHAFPGFYQNAFRTVRALWQDLGWQLDTEDGPLTGAFVPRDQVGVMDRFGPSWSYFPTPIRPNGRIPGALPAVADAATGDIGEALRGLVQRIAGSVRAGLDGRDTQGDRDLAEVVATLRLPWQRSIERVAGWLGRRSAIDIEALVETPLAVSRTKRWIVHLLDDVRSGLRWYFRDSSGDDASAWFEWGTLDTLLTIAIGVLTEATLDFDDLDDRDFRGWLVEHGLAAEHHEIAAITQVYETLFAHAPELPYRYGELACGVGLRWFLLMAFGYGGHIAYDFKWACPETLMSPYLLALEHHGARVHFFHRVSALELDGDGDGKQLARVRLAVQARVVGDGRYQPFIGGARPDRTPPAWPAHPDYAQLVGGAQLAERHAALESGYDAGSDDELVLEHGRDFDACVVAIPLGALPPLVRELTDPASPRHDPRWRAMTEGVSLIQTVSAQLWLDRDADQLFEGPPRGLLTGFEQPQASLGVLSHLIASERWPEPPPKTSLYFTGALLAGAQLPAPGPALLEQAEQQRRWWREQFELWLAKHYRELFTRGPAGYEQLLDLLRVPERDHAARGSERLAAQWFDIACHPSDLYVLSRPGELRLRMAPHESGVRFMLLAGDWTRTDLNCGCVEAATQSGMLAARALSGEPVYVWRTGF